MIIVVSKGSHNRNLHIPAFDGEPRQFAHRFDPNDPEDVPHQVQNFWQYAKALGGFHPPIILYGPDPMPENEQEADHIAVQMSDWASLVESSTGMAVEIR
jgi:hypothetical protein